MTLSKKDLAKAAFSGAKIGIIGPFITGFNPVAGGVAAAAVSAATNPVADMAGVSRSYSPAIAGALAYGATMVPQVGIGAANPMVYAALAAVCDYSSDMVANALGIQF